MRYTIQHIQGEKGRRCHHGTIVEVSVVNSDEEPPEEHEQEDIDDPQDLDDENDEDGSQRGHEDEDEEGSQRDLEGLDSDTLKHRFANEVGSFMPLSQLMIIL